MNVEWVFAIALIVCLAVLIICTEAHDRKKDRAEKEFLKRALRVSGTVTDFGLPEPQGKCSQSFCVLYEIGGQQYTVTSGLISKALHVFKVGEKVGVLVDPLDHSKAMLAINQRRRSFGNPYGDAVELRWWK